MGKIITAFVAAAILVLAPGSASAASLNASLNGHYVFQVHGFMVGGTVNQTGEIAALGLLTFDGAGHVSGNVTFTTADSGANQAHCTGALSTVSGYTVNGDGTGTLLLSFTTASGCVTSIPAEIEATITFSLVLNNGATAAQPVATSAFFLSNNIGSPGAITYIQTEAILTVALQGGLRLQGSDPSVPSGVNRLSN